jgi:two-component system LytT family response regulator
VKNEMISIAIVDDETKARETIRNVLALDDQDKNILGEADGVNAAYDLIRQTNPDLVLLDIDMPDGTGFDLLKKFDEIPFKFIFITAYEEFAVRAFKFSAIDYILKPFRAAELLDAVKKASKTIESEKNDLKFKTFLSNLDKLQKIVLRTAESMHIVHLSQIIRLESDVNYTRFFLAGGKQLLVSKTLKEYDELLVDSGFFRSHQSHLVNLDHMLRFDKTEGGHLVMDDESQVPVSSRKRDALFRLFDKMG